ncbi:unnamed protein product [Rotaria sp. Silwood2]|nr:unnamed protein product [Rotaria sp. Silwood2]CAF2526893.1 unnamed protein product [Rotaria sp. Silwood2]CAF2758060.1 unnamed protein product [Rotaria sp. Silwood2]CAF2936340.1 unnamed protein product [Rotaria sp. Silwood2]CAF4027878.1 unnamed protein product [Rotaria sp. Silwood2]
MNQQQQMKRQMQQTHSNLIKSSQMALTRSTSTSTVILDEEILGDQIQLPVSLSTNLSTPLRSVLKTSGLFNKDWESSDKLNELFTNGNEFTLHRLLSDIGVNDVNFDMNDIAKFDPMKLLDTRSLSEFLQYDSLDQMNMSNDINANHIDSILPSATACSSGSFSELCPSTPEQPAKEIFHIETNQLKMESDNSLVYTQLDSFDDFVPTPSTSAPIAQKFNFDPSALAAFEHDYGFLSKRTTVFDTPSPSPTISKRTPTRRCRRTSSRLQSRAQLIDFNQILNENTCSSPTISEDSSISLKRTKNPRHIHRATDIKTEDDLSYYLERRRKNNEASKVSRAVRKQKFGDMDLRCAEYERVNVELRLKISTLETVTASLKNGLIHNFQRKGGVEPKF